MRLKIASLKTIAFMMAASAYALVHAGEAPYPAKNVTIIVPFAPGGSADILQRAVAKGLADMWGRSVIID
ncbi:MAG TPA: ABC transporter substrate-binding protein, partial [Burkholderiales bacterium]|nr:ABC transporter substrate-binding protein [Burkholderiales bacterium]